MRLSSGVARVRACTQEFLTIDQENTFDVYLDQFYRSRCIEALHCGKIPASKDVDTLIRYDVMLSYNF